MWNAETVVLAVVGGILTIVSGAGFWQYLTHRKDEPVRRRDADIAAAHVSQQMALAVAEANRQTAESNRQDNSDLRKDLDRVRQDLAEESRRSDRLEQRLNWQAHVNQILRAWIEDIVLRWEELRHKATPPAQPRLPDPPE